MKKETLDEELYQENIMDHYHNPRNKKELSGYTNKYCEFNPTCGDEITIFLKVEKDGVKEVSFTGTGCAISQAAASLLTEKLSGLTIKQLKSKMNSKRILTLLGVPISPARMNCALLALRATLKALEKKSEK